MIWWHFCLITQQKKNVTKKSPKNPWELDVKGRRYDRCVDLGALQPTPGVVVSYPLYVTLEN